MLFAGPHRGCNGTPLHRTTPMGDGPCKAEYTRNRMGRTSRRPCSDYARYRDFRAGASGIEPNRHLCSGLDARTFHLRAVAVRDGDQWMHFRGRRRLAGLLGDTLPKADDRRWPRASASLRKPSSRARVDDHSHPHRPGSLSGDSARYFQDPGGRATPERGRSHRDRTPVLVGVPVPWSECGDRE